MLLSALFLLLGASLASPADTVPPATVVDLVEGADACATQKLSDAKMAERLTSLGWTFKTKAAGPGTGGTIAFYERNNVRLTYFHSQELTECVASAAADPSIDLEALVTALTTKFGKPKVDSPGVRYLFSLPRLNILTLQNKTTDQGRSIELAVVH